MNCFLSSTSCIFYMNNSPNYTINWTPNVVLYFYQIPARSLTSTATTSVSPFTWGSNETIYGVWNTTAAGNSAPATVGSHRGNYYSLEVPQCACDSNLTNKYTSFGQCNSTYSSEVCGTNTGFYVTPRRGSSMITGFRIYTAATLPLRDPLTVTVEGSNNSSSVLTFGSSWTLLYNGTSGLANDPGRSAWGTQISFNNSVQYASYRFLVVSKRGLETATWYAEVQLIGY